MVQDLSWGELLHEITKIRQSATPLPAHWFAVEHHEDNGVWVLGIDGSSSEDEVAIFTLFAARAMEKAGLRPIPVPLPSEHDPQWDLYRQFIEDGTRQRGEEIDLSNAVPYGLGAIDRDAVDPCTRAWLEELRRDGTAFQSVEGTFSIGGQKVKTFDGEFKDVYQATSIYCKRRLRNEIGARLFTGAGERERTAPEGGLESNAQATHLIANMVNEGCPNGG